jgi:hypothetical protein
MNDNVFTLGEAGKAAAGKALEADVQRVQFNNWQRDVIQELKGINTNLVVLKKRTEYVVALIIAGIAFAFIYPWINSL